MFVFVKGIGVVQPSTGSRNLPLQMLAELKEEDLIPTGFLG